MKWLYVFNVVIWLVAGAINLASNKDINLASNKIDKFSYAIVWIVLMMNLIGDCIEAFMV